MNALLGNAASRHARKKTYPFKGRSWGSCRHEQPVLRTYRMAFVISSKR